jgi:hypothetical protein
MTGAFGAGNGIPGKGGNGAGGSAGFTGSALDFFLFFLNPMTSPIPKGGLNSIEPYRKKPHNYRHYLSNLFDYSSPSFKN